MFGEVIQNMQSVIYENIKSEYLHTTATNAGQPALP